MDIKKARLYTVLIRIGIALVATAFLVLFVFQYSKMIKLQSQKDALSSQYQTAYEQNQSMQEQIDQIKDNENEDQPNQEYVVDTAHENGYVGDDETYIES